MGELHANTPFARIRAEQERAQKPREMVAHIQAALRPMPQRGNRRALQLEMVRRVMLQQAAIDCDAQRIPRPARARDTPCGKHNANMIHMRTGSMAHALGYTIRPT